MGGRAAAGSAARAVEVKQKISAQGSRDLDMASGGDSGQWSVISGRIAAGLLVYRAKEPGKSCPRIATVNPPARRPS